jgi:hypothetical protein
MRAVAAYSRRHEIVLANNNEQDELTHRANESTLKNLNIDCNRLVEKLRRARRTLADQQLKLKVMQTAKGKKEHSIESKMFKMLKDIGVALSLYHGGSLNGKDTKKEMNNATYFFDGLVVILKEGKRVDSLLSNDDIDTLCLHCWEVFVLWDGAFLLAQTVNPMKNDTTTYLHYVVAAVHGHEAIRCTVTPKVHLMLKHVAWQMRNILGGLGKMEDWIKQGHQTGMHLQERFCTVQNPTICAVVWEKASSRLSHPNVIAHTKATNAGNKHSFSVAKIDDSISTRQKKQQDMGQYEAMIYFKKGSEDG